jgi:DNA-binding PadR family transcriptional regulator
MAHPELDPSAPIFKGFIRGMLPLYLLITLQDRPLHGTELIKSLSTMSGHSWKPSPGSVYPVLRRLESEGLIAGRWKRSQAAPQRVYRLTAAGRRSLPELRNELIRQLTLARALIDAHITAFETMGASDDE